VAELGALTELAALKEGEVAALPLLRSVLKPQVSTLLS